MSSQAICASCSTSFHGNCRPYSCISCGSLTHRKCSGVRVGMASQSRRVRRSGNAIKVEPGTQARTPNAPSELPPVRQELQGYQRNAAIRLEPNEASARSQDATANTPARTTNREPDTRSDLSESSESLSVPSSGSSAPMASTSEQVTIDVPGTHEKERTSILKYLAKGIRGNFLISAIVLVVVLVSFFGLVAFLFISGRVTTASPPPAHVNAQQGITSPTPLEATLNSIQAFTPIARTLSSRESFTFKTSAAPPATPRMALTRSAQRKINSFVSSPRKAK